MDAEKFNVSFKMMVSIMENAVIVSYNTFKKKTYVSVSLLSL